MGTLIEILNVVFAFIISFFLIFKPIPFMKFIGTVYWHLGRFTALGKSEETKKYFIGKNTFWFRLLGIIMLILICISVLARISEKVS